jgi:hypothetical protein
VLPTGKKYDYTCEVCGTAVGGKQDNDASEFYASAPPPPTATPTRPVPPGTPRRLGPR